MKNKDIFLCPNCGAKMEKHKKPSITVDTIIELSDQIVLIERKNSPSGWAIPGGFVEYGETVEQAAIREAKEETSLDIRLVTQLGVYSNPRRDPRHHTISVVFIARTFGKPKAADDAKAIGLFTESTVPKKMAFDHADVLVDYFKWKKMI